MGGASVRGGRRIAGVRLPWGVRAGYRRASTTADQGRAWPAVSDVSRDNIVCGTYFVRTPLPCGRHRLVPARASEGRHRRSPQTPAEGRDSALAGELARVLRDRLREVERGGDDPVLLDGVGDRIALARGGALGPADVAEVRGARAGPAAGAATCARGRPCCAAPPGPRRPRGGSGSCATSSRISALRERVEQLDPADRHVGLVGLARAWWPDEVVVDLAGAQDQPRDLARRRRAARPAPAWKRPSARCSRRLVAWGRRSRLFGVMTTSGRCLAIRAWRRSRWKYWAGVVGLATRMLPSAASWRKRSSRAEECSGPEPS